MDNKIVRALMMICLFSIPVLAQSPEPKAGGDARLQDLLEPIRQKHALPALAGAIVTSKRNVSTVLRHLLVEFSVVSSHFSYSV